MPLRFSATNASATRHNRFLKSKDPSEASLGLYARLTAQALGERGAWKRPAFVTLSRVAFRNLYKIAHRDCMAGLLSTGPAK
jgi:hypothetical protein